MHHLTTYNYTITQLNKGKWIAIENRGDFVTATTLPELVEKLVPDGMGNDVTLHIQPQGLHSINTNVNRISTH